MGDLSTTKLRCSPFHEATGADPVGSAGHYDGFLCVEVALPWERDISMHEPFVSLGAQASIAGADGRSWRPQGLVPRDGGLGATRVLAFDSPAMGGSGVGPFVRREWSVEPDRLTVLCRAILSGSDRSLSEFDDARADVDGAVTDLFVCTHGRRDVCCGGSGTELYTEVVERFAERNDLRIWRVSHTGGHRFAPTALTFPDGYAWAHLDVDVVDRLLRHDADLAPLAGHCRGWSRLASPPMQAADREGLVQFGRDWASSTRLARAVEFDRETMDTTVEIDATFTDGSRRSLRVLVGIETHIPQPTCGLIDEPEYSVSPVWRVLDQRSLEPSAQ